MLFVLSLSNANIRAQDQAIYTDTLQGGWQSWSYNTTVNLGNPAPVHGGTASISATVTSSYGALWLQAPAFSTTTYTNLVFWINGGASGGQLLSLRGVTNNVSIAPGTNLPALVANTWQQFVIPLAAIGLAKQPGMTGFWLQSRTPTNATFYVDDVSLVSLPVVTNITVTIVADAQSQRHPISPLIYGAAFATSNQLKDLNFTLNRSGGNSETRYNWLINAHNHAADYYFESLADDSATPGASTDEFIRETRSGGAAAMVTVPMIGWAPKLGTTGDGRLASYSIAKYGPQTGNDYQWFPDAGNGVSVTNNTPIIWNDPNDANTPVNSGFEKNYVQHLTSTWGAATNGGVKFYLMDNEHTIWHSTHRDVHPVGTTMQEIRDRIFDYASMVRSNDPNALICAPEEWGWPGYLYSGYDQQWSGNNSDYNPAHYPDRGTNGGADYMPWLLNQLHQHELATGVRLLDVFTLHCYPQEGNVGSSATDAATQTLRNQATRQFWDTNYVDPSWINSVIMLIPRMKIWATNYPGVKIGVTEYNWGAENDIGGATAQADILGIFGREGLDLATRWATPTTGTPAYLAMKMFRNYDGNRSTFGDTSVACLNSTNTDLVSAFAAARTNDGALTVLVINKQLLASATISLALTNFSPASPVEVWQLTAANSITRLADLVLVGAQFTNTVPPQSITLFVVPAGAAPQLQPGALAGNTFTFWLNGQTGQRYAVQRSTNLTTWQTLQTNLLNTPSLQLFFAATNLQKAFYRAQWTP